MVVPYAAHSRRFNELNETGGNGDDWQTFTSAKIKGLIVVEEVDVIAIDVNVNVWL
jgi:hypothetical protein